MKFPETLHNKKPTTYCITINKKSNSKSVHLQEFFPYSAELRTWDHPTIPGVRLRPRQTRFDGPREPFQKFLPGNSHRIHPPVPEKSTRWHHTSMLRGSWGWMKFWICFIRIALKQKNPYTKRCMMPYTNHLTIGLTFALRCQLAPPKKRGQHTNRSLKR